jgi:predicted transposase YbfD/YdcC
MRSGPSHQPGLSSLVLVESIRQLGAEERVKRRDYISSLPGTTDNAAKRLNSVIRMPWEIENRVPWVLDVAIGEEACCARESESAQTLALMRKLD